MIGHHNSTNMKRLFFSIALLSILFFISSCDDDDVIDVQTIDLVILDENDESPNLVLADGFSIINLKATIPIDADDSITEVEFRKSNGEFLGVEGVTINRPLNDDNEAQIAVRVPNTVEQLFFNATISFGGSIYTSEADIDLRRAYADAIFLEPSTLQVTLSNAITLNVFLTRNIGEVSLETDASFEAFQVQNGSEISVGRFTGLSNAETDMNGQIIVSFITDTGNIDTELPITIRVTTMSNNNEMISESFNLAVND